LLSYAPEKLTFVCSSIPNEPYALRHFCAISILKAVVQSKGFEHLGIKIGLIFSCYIYRANRNRAKYLRW
jgi:hypothetical protein